MRRCVREPTRSTKGAVLKKALADSPYLTGDRFTAADLICASPYAWFPAITPDEPEIKAWIERCQARSAAQKVVEFDQRAMAA